MSEAPTQTPPTPETTEAPVAAVKSVESGSPLGLKPEGEAPVEGASTETAPTVETTLEGAPETYDFKLPEGIEASESLTKFSELAKAANIPQAKAQELLDLYYAETKTQTEAFSKAQESAWTSTIDGWKGEMAKAYPGAKLTEAQVRVGKALDEYGSPEARAAFDLTGAGWNPHVFALFDKMAAALSEGSLRAAGSPVGRTGASLGDRLYPDS